MFIVMFPFGDNRSKASNLMDAHNRWIQKGFDDGVFLLTGGLQPQRGGAILAHNTTETELADRIAQDPFVAEGVVTSEVVAITPGQVDDRLAFIGSS